MTEFYPHPRMADGHLNYCKECVKVRIRCHRRGPAGEKIRAYDRARGNRQSGYSKRYRQEYPEKYKAQCAAWHAIRDGKLHREPCEVCGATEVHAHHDDYSEPLSVRWLCPVHHARHHAGEEVS